MRGRWLVFGASFLLLLFLAPQVYGGSILVASHSGATDPLSERWTQVYFGTSDVTAGPVVNDLGTGIDAWYVYDTGTDLGDLGGYSAAVSSTLVALGNAYGWKLSAYIRVLSGSGTAGGSPMVLYRDGTKSWQLHFGTTAGGDPIVRLYGGPSGPSVDYTLTGLGGQYNLYELIYDPVRAEADLYVNGSLLHSGYKGFSYSGTYVFWGAGSSPDTGRGHFADVKFYVNPEPSSVLLWALVPAAWAIRSHRRRLHRPAA